MKWFTIAAALVASAWAQSTSSYTPIPEKLFNELKAAAGVGWTYSEDGCTAPAIRDRNPDTTLRDRWIQENTFSIKDGAGGDIIVRIFRKEKAKEIYLFFPGTKAPTNWNSDLNVKQVSYTFSGFCSGCMVHEGFLQAFKGGQSAIEFNVRFYKGKYPDHKIVIAGGSLGGGLAAIAFAEFKTNSQSGIDVDRAITFGQPRIGNQAWANFMNYITVANAGLGSKFARVTHGYDFFVRVPPPANWVHHGSEIWAEDSARDNNRPVVSSTVVCPINGNSENGYCAQRAIAGSGNAGDHTSYPGYGFNYEQAFCTAA